MRSWSFLRGVRAEGRYRRYALTLIAGCAIIACLATSIYAFTPRTYTSAFTLILPGAGPSSSVNLETLGQASSQSASPFASQNLSPTENYKRLFQSYRLRGEVAERMGLSITDVPAPRIRLANQTQLIYVSLSASSPDMAFELATTWLQVFSSEIAALRTEEQIIREEAASAVLLKFEQAVEESRAKIITFQTEHGLISVEQFQELVQRNESLKFAAQEALTNASVSGREKGRLSSLLDLSPQRANEVMLLQSDPVFQSLHQGLSNAEIRRAELAGMFGTSHPERRAAEEEYAGLRQALGERGRTLIGFESFGSLNLSQYSANSERARLVGRLVQADAAYAGANERIASLDTQMDETAARVQALAGPATELDALLRDHQIAETVFASALARIDTNRTDMFASYPLTQTIEQPARPETAATPSKKIVLLGAAGTMFLYVTGLILLWVRLPIIRLLLKTV